MLSQKGLVRARQSVRRWPVTKGLVLLLFWLLLAGRSDLHHIALGLAVVCLSLFVSSKLIPASPLPAIDDRTWAARASVMLWLPLELAGYFARMVWELVQANVRVAAIVLRVRMPLAPVIYEYHPPVHAEWARVLLANSVTLTPGTLTVELGPDRFLVHALTPDAAHALPGWSAEKRVAKIESRLRQPQR